MSSGNWAPAYAGATTKFVSPAKAGAQFLLLLLLAGCALRPPSPDTFTFAVLGDLAYSPREEAMFVDTLRRIDLERPAFTVHVGDFKGYGPCSDELFALRLSQMNASASPLIFTPGDNEWTDCRRQGSGPTDPIERLARLRTMFFADGWSLGQRRIATTAQDQCLANPPSGCGCAAHPENRLWRHNRVYFVTLNMPGHQNNVGHDAANDLEAKCRDAANAAWLERAAREAESDAIRALVVITHANLWETPAKHRTVFHAVLEQLRALPPRLRKPMLFVHGDTHTFRVTPFDDAAGNPVPGIIRLETHGTPAIGWVRVTVEPDRPDPFGFEARLVGISLPH